MRFDRVSTDHADEPYIVAGATVMWVIDIPDDIADKTDDLHAEFDGIEKEFTDRLIREMRLDRDDEIGDYDVNVSTLVVQEGGDDTDGE